MKKEIKHDCPTDMIFSNTKGKCIQPDLETKEYTENPSSRDHSAANLKMPKSGPANAAHIVKRETAADSRAVKKTEFQDIHVDMVDKATNQQTQVQNIGFRVQGKNDIKAKTKFRNFSAKHGNKSTNL